MKTVTLRFYDVPNARGKMKRTTYRLSPEEAAKRLPAGAVPVEADSLTIEQPENDDEREMCLYTRTTAIRR
jgi:hypothetical protein